MYQIGKTLTPGVDYLSCTDFRNSQNPSRGRKFLKKENLFFIPQTWVTEKWTDMEATSLGFTIQQKDNMVKPDLVTDVDDDGLISMKFKVKLNKTCDGPADKQNTNSIITLKNGNFVQKQT